jgi:hypothetical protein
MQIAAKYALNIAAALCVVLISSPRLVLATSLSITSPPSGSSSIECCCTELSTTSSAPESLTTASLDMISDRWAPLAVCTSCRSYLDMRKEEQRDLWPGDRE